MTQLSTAWEQNLGRTTEKHEPDADTEDIMITTSDWKLQAIQYNPYAVFLKVK